MSDKQCNLLFVCTGNLCRSPLSEGILKKMLSEQGVQHIHVASAGMMAKEGAPATNLTQSVAQQHGIDLSQHKAQYVSAELVGSSDLILVMEKIHQLEIETWFPSSKGKVFLLRSFGPNGIFEEVDDPIGGTSEIFDLCYQLLESEIQRMLPELLERCGKN